LFGATASLIPTSNYFLALCLALQACFPLLSHNFIDNMFAAAAGIQLEIGSGQYGFSLRGAVASRVIVDHKQSSWSCLQGVQSLRLTFMRLMPVFKYENNNLDIEAFVTILSYSDSQAL
jgi:hypothetical protein